MGWSKLAGGRVPTGGPDTDALVAQRSGDVYTALIALGTFAALNRWHSKLTVVDVMATAGIIGVILLKRFLKRLDDHSRYAYVEQHRDQGEDTAAAVLAERSSTSQGSA